MHKDNEGYNKPISGKITNFWGEIDLISDKNWKNSSEKGKMTANHKVFFLKKIEKKKKKKKLDFIFNQNYCEKCFDFLQNFFLFI